MGQDVVGQNFVGQDVTGAISLGQNVVGQEVSGAGRRGADLRGAGRRWGKIFGAGCRGAEGSGAGSGSPRDQLLSSLVCRFSVLVSCRYLHMKRTINVKMLICFRKLFMQDPIVTKTTKLRQSLLMTECKITRLKHNS